MQFVNIGYGNIIAANRIISIITPGAAPTKRMVQEAKQNMLVIDATTGRKTRAVIVMDTRAYCTFCNTARNYNKQTR